MAADATRLADIDDPRPPVIGSDPTAALAWAVRVGADLPSPATGRTAELWQFLAGTARADVAAARILEPHLDALAVLAEARAHGFDTAAVARAVAPDASWGVFAAEGAGLRLEATRDDTGWTLTGTKPWCSLAAHLSAALVTAWTGPTERRLFAVSLAQPAVTARPGPWVARGLASVVSAPVDFAAAVATPIGDDGWYLTRRGFAWGGMGVAAAWWGGALPLIDALADAARRPNADQLATALLGEADAASWAARVVLVEAAAAVDTGIAGTDAAILAERVRSVVATAAERVLSLADAALGPAPLATDEDHARRVDDLRLYLRQHHGPRDLARLGRKLVDG